VADAILVSDGVEARYGAEIGRLAPGRPRVVVGPDGCTGDPATSAICFFSGDIFPERSVPFLRQMIRAKQLQWFHTFSAGVDDPFFQGLLARGVRLSTSAGAQAGPIAHTVMLYLLALSRDLPGWLAAQRDHRWEPRDVVDLQGRRMLVVGMGPIGSEVARLGLAFGMEVLGLRRTPRGDEPCETRPLAELDDLLPSCDALVLAIPLVPETHHLIDAARLAKLPEGALLVNVARGDVVDEDALIAALEEGRLGGAGLDVFHEEPLPAASPLWEMPRVIVTPHSSGTTPANWDRAAAIFLDNLGRFERGEPLRNEAVAKR
jgi:D-2-hydroxyacid dehydrogenase (NADP+)